ncbi:MAG: glycosyltransferase, partial [Acidisphaera sp.]|nr:glycosyltransferase [Acidisphaera sp.]
SADNARLVAWRFVPSSSHLATPHSVWAEPDVDDLTAALLEAVRFGARNSATGVATVDALFGSAGFVRRLTQAALAVLLAPPPTPVRVGWISTWGVRCGVAEYSRHLLRHLPASPAVAEIVVLADRRSIAAAADENAIRVRPAWEIGHPDGVAGLLAAVVQEDPQVVVVQHQPGLFGWGVLAQLLAGIAGRTVVVTLHNTRDILDMTQSERSLALATLSGVSRVVVHTITDLNRFSELGLVDNVTLLPHGVPEPASDAPARTLSHSASPVDAGPLIGSYGFFLPDKGLRELVSAFALLRRDWPGARLRLVNAEYDAPESAVEIAACRAIAARTGVAEAIEWCTDFLPDARSLELLAACDVVVLPYQRSKEASSAALRMALASGAPVLATDLPLFDEAASAIARCASGSDSALAAALSELLADQPMRAELQEAGRAWLGERQWGDIARRLQGMLLGLAAQQGVPRNPVVCPEIMDAADERSVARAE